MHHNVNQISSGKLNRIWTCSEIDLLKREFNNGTRIKLIAAKLGRSETAVNKILSRTGIRPQKLRVTKNKNNYKAEVNRAGIPSREDIPIIKLNKIFNDYVDFEEVLRYLKSKRHKITKIISDTTKIFYPTAEYILNGQPVSKAKLLIFANKIRTEENAREFKVLDVY